MYGEREVLTFKGLLRYLCLSLSLSLSLSTLEEFVETKALKRLRKTRVTKQKQVGWIGWKKLECDGFCLSLPLSSWSFTTEVRRWVGVSLWFGPWARVGACLAVVLFFYWAGMNIFRMNCAPISTFLWD